MRKLAIVCGMGLLLSGGIVIADEYVEGYYKKNGTYVQPYHRSSPDSSYNNNWSVSPNVNPYTGQQGSEKPTYNDKPPSDDSNGGRSQRAW